MPSPRSRQLADMRGQFGNPDFEFDTKPWLDARGAGNTFLYFIQAFDEPFTGNTSGPIKIGTALNPHKRRQTLQTGNPRRLALGTVEWVHHSFERTMHTLFSEYRLEGEWFRAHPLLADIASCEPDPELLNEPFKYPTSTPLRVPDLLDDRFARTLGNGLTEEDYEQWRKNPDQGYTKPLATHVEPITAPPPGTQWDRYGISRWERSSADVRDSRAHKHRWRPAA